MKRFLVALVVAFITLVAVNLAMGKETKYPNKPITFIIPYGTGGMTDLTARMITEQMKPLVGQPMIIVNKPGASGMIGLKELLRAKPDGYTLAFTTVMPFPAPYFKKMEPFDMEAFKYVGSYMPQERVILAQNDAPYRTWPEFIEYVRKNPGKVTFGAGGANWTIEVMKSVAIKEGGLKMRYVLFKSGGDAASAILGGHVDLVETGVGTAAYQAARAGKLRILVGLGAGSIPNFPDVPNLADLGYPFLASNEYGILLPGGVSESIRQYWEDQLRRVMEDPVFLRKMLDIGFVPRFLPGREWKRKCITLTSSVPELLKYNKTLKE